MESIKQGKPFMVLDVEGASNCRPYNIGYIIGDKYGNIYEKRSIAILPCIWENLQNSNAFTKHMTHKNIQEILNDIENNNNNNKYCYSSIGKVKAVESYSLLYGVQQHLLKIGITTTLRPKSNENCFVLEFSNKADILKFLDYIYPKDSEFIVLQRKYLKNRALRLELEENGEGPEKME